MLIDLVLVTMLANRDLVTAAVAIAWVLAVFAVVNWAESDVRE